MARQREVISLLCLMICVLIGTQNPAWAIDWYVDDDGPFDPGPGDSSVSDPAEDGTLKHPFDSIQEAIAAAGEGDTVIVADGVYAGLGNRDIEFQGKALTVRSETGPESCVIDCQGQGRGFFIHNEEGPETVLQGFTIKNGNANVFNPQDPSMMPGAGGGICILNSSPRIIDCQFIDNEAYAGGGINNSVSFFGDFYCNPVIMDCIFENNSAWNGGGIANIGNSNTPSYDRYGRCGPKVINCVFKENQAGQWGGGINNDYGVNISIDRCLFLGNRALRGGGLHNFDQVQHMGMVYVNLSNSIFAGNNATYIAGGIYTRSRQFTMTNCTICGNYALDKTGGINNSSQYHGNFNIYNSIIWGNTSRNQYPDYWHPSYTYARFYNSCIEDNMAGDDFVWGVEGCIDFDPCFVREPYDGGDGWGVGNNDDYGDLHLQRDSPCVNLGDNTLAWDPEAKDIDQQPRIMDFDVDMGADEVEMSHLLVTIPIGGEVWIAESRHEIKWENYHVYGPVDIFYSSNNGGDWITVGKKVDNSGSYLWKVPQVDSSECLVKVLLTDEPDYINYEQCEETFTIHRHQPSRVVSAEWPTLGNNYKRQGLSDNTGPETGYVKWQFETETPVYQSVTIGADNHVHIATEGGIIYTLDEAGEQVWRYDTAAAITNSPSVGPDGTIYVGDEKGRFYAVDKMGKTRWTFDTDGAIVSTAAVSKNGKIYLGTDKGALYGLNRRGVALWKYILESDSPAVEMILAPLTSRGNALLYAGALYSSRLHAISADSGEVVWVSDLGVGEIFTAPVVADDGTIYIVPLYDHHLYAINPADGEIIWQTDLSVADPVWLDPSENQGQEYINEHFSWYCMSEPALGPDGTIYVSFDDQYLRAVNPDGTIKWIKQVGMVGGFTLAVGADGLIYAACDDRTLYVLNTDGEVLSQFSGDHFLTYPVIGADGTLYLSDSAMTVWALAAEQNNSEPRRLYRPGDVNLDGVINLQDMSLLNQMWLDRYESPELGYLGNEKYLPGDINRDKRMNLEDFAILGRFWMLIY